MKLTLIWVGRTKDGRLKALIDDYLKRIGRQLPVEVREVKEEPASDRHAAAEALLKEGRRIRERIPRDHEVVLLDEAGRALTSEQFAAFLGEKLGSSSSATRGVAFVVGGHQGVDDEMKRTASHVISLSPMTLTHEMARLVAVEQIFRGLGIMRGSSYHRSREGGGEKERNGQDQTG